jgi:hypothetical protein
MFTAYTEMGRKPTLIKTIPRSRAGQPQFESEWVPDARSRIPPQ